MSGPILGRLEAGLAAAAFGVLACGVLLPKFVSYDADEFKKAQAEAAEPV